MSTLPVVAGTFMFAPEGRVPLPATKVTSPVLSTVQIVGSDDSQSIVWRVALAGVIVAFSCSGLPSSISTLSVLIVTLSASISSK